MPNSANPSSHDGLGPGRRDDPGSDGTGIGRIELRDLLGEGLYYIPDTM